MLICVTDRLRAIDPAMTEKRCRLAATAAAADSRQTLARQGGRPTKKIITCRPAIHVASGKTSSNKADRSVPSQV